MKKVLTTLACGLVLASGLSADFVRAEIGAGVWMQGPGGEISPENPSTTFNGEDALKSDVASQAYVWMFIKHPVPVVPNLRLEYVKASGEGSVTGKFQDFEATGNLSNIDLTQVDIIPYYNLLDNTFFVTLDVGVDLKVIASDYTAEGVTLSSTTPTIGDYTKTESVVIPMGYARVRGQIPFAGVGAEADVKYIKYGESTVYDVRAKLDYTLTFIPVIQPGIELGYRVQKFEINDIPNLELNIDFAGFYAGAMLRF